MYNLLNIYSTLSYTALIILKGNFIFNLSTRTHIVSFYLPTTYMSIAPLRSMLCLKGIRTERIYANLHKCRQVINGLVLRPKGSRLTLARAPHSRREPQNEPLNHRNGETRCLPDILWKADRLRADSVEGQARGRGRPNILLMCFYHIHIESQLPERVDRMTFKRIGFPKIK